MKTTSKVMTIGTCNVRNLKGVSKLTIEIDRYRCNVIGLCESRWGNSEELMTDEGHNIVYIYVYSGRQKYHQHGVTCIEMTDIVSTILNYEPISSRIILILLACSPMDVTSIQKYVPTSDYDYNVIE